LGALDGAHRDEQPKNGRLVGFGWIRLDSVGFGQFGRVWGGGFSGFREEIGDFGGVFAGGCEGGEGIGDLLKTGGEVEGGGEFDEMRDGITGFLGAL